MNSMAELALALYVLYLALAFGLRAVVQHRRTGDWGFRLPPPSASPSERAGALLFVLALAFGLAAPVLDLVGALRPNAALSGPAARNAGVILFLLGASGTLWAQFAMRDAWRVGVDPTERTELRTTGPFRRVRNPIFSFMILTATGLALLVPNLASLAGLVALLAGVELQVRLVEEPHLLRAHRAAYASYASSAGRFVPGIGKLRFPRHDPYS